MMQASVKHTGRTVIVSTRARTLRRLSARGTRQVVGFVQGYKYGRHKKDSGGNLTSDLRRLHKDGIANTCRRACGSGVIILGNKTMKH